MPGEFTTKGSNIALEAVVGRTTQSARTMYLVLLTAAPNDGTTLATMAEVTTAGYARKAATFTAPAGDPAALSNDSVITFGPFTADPPNITHLALVSALTGTVGDLTVIWTLDVAKDPAINESLQFPVGSIVATCD